MNHPVFVEDIFKKIAERVSGVQLVGFGSLVHLLNKLQELNNSTTSQNKKYPLIWIFTKIVETRGNDYYSNISIPRIIIANSTTPTWDTDTRLEQNFKNVLYPIYDSFITEIAKDANTVINDPGSIQHNKSNFYGDQPIGQGLNDYVDMIDIRDLKVTILQTVSCG